MSKIYEFLFFIEGVEYKNNDKLFIPPHELIAKADNEKDLREYAHNIVDMCIDGILKSESRKTKIPVVRIKHETP
jgi:hypothetical protein